MEIRDGSGDRLGGLGLLGRSSGRFGMRREVLPGRPDWSEVPPWGMRRMGGPSEGPRRVGRSSGRSEMGRGTLPEVRDRLGVPQGGLGNVG